METKTCVLIADIDEDFRRLLGDVLSQEDDMECVGNTDNGVEALTLAAERQPDVLVMDLVLLKLDGIEVLRRLPEACPRREGDRRYTSVPKRDSASVHGTRSGVFRAGALRHYRTSGSHPPDRRAAESGGGASACAHERRKSRSGSHRDHPRDRRSGAHKGLSVPARGDNTYDKRHGYNQCRHQGAVSRGREKIRHNAVARRARNTPCHRGRVGSRRYRGFAEILRLHRVEYQRQADKQRVHRHDSRLPFPASKTGRNAVKTQAVQGFIDWTNMAALR